MGCDEIDRDVQDIKVKEDSLDDEGCCVISLLNERCMGVQAERTPFVNFGIAALQSMARCYGFTRSRGDSENKIKSVSREMQSFAKACVPWAIASLESIESHWTGLHEALKARGVSSCTHSVGDRSPDSCHSTQKSKRHDTTKLIQ